MRANWVPSQAQWFFISLFSCSLFFPGSAVQAHSLDHSLTEILHQLPPGSCSPEAFLTVLPVLLGYMILTPGPHPLANDTQVSVDGTQATSY